MNATLEDRSPTRPARPWVMFLAEALILSAVMAAPYFLLENFWGMIVIALVVLGYIVWVVGSAVRRSRAGERPPFKAHLLVAGIQTCAAFITVGLGAAIILAWVSWAYSIDIIAETTGAIVWLIPGVAVAAPALFLAIIASRPGRESRPTPDFRAAIHRKGFGPFRRSWLAASAFTLAIFCLLVVIAGVFAAQFLLDSFNTGEEPSMWDVVLTFPFLPLALIAGAAMLAIFRAGERENSTRAIVQAYAEEGGSAAPGTGGGLAVACGLAVTLYVILYPFHLGLVAWLSPVAGITPTMDTAEAVETWVEEQRAEGRTGAELAAILDEHGRWSADSPEAGLPELFPDLKDTLPSEGTSELASCSITLAAGVADPAAVRDVDWLEVEQAESDLRYCIRTSCPSPVKWEAPGSILLFSSHFSQNEHWVENIFIDVFATGRAIAPGGYCTASGELAESFQG